MAKSDRRTIISVAVTAVVSIITFGLLVYVLEAFLLPILPETWRTRVVSIGASAVGTLVIMAAIAEATGYSLRDIFSKESPPDSPLPASGQKGVILAPSRDSSIDWSGDILQHGSTKVVIDDSMKVKDLSREDYATQLVADIQSNLHTDNSCLPYVLTLCIDLSDRIGLSEEYGRWLRKELYGYPDYQGFRCEFENDTAFETWMEEWASHRRIQTYIKVWFPAQEGQRARVEDFPYEKSFFGFSVAEIARMIQAGRESRNQEFSTDFRRTAPERYAEFLSFLIGQLPGLQVPPDLSLFYNVAGLEQVLNGVRDKVLSLLSEARQRMA